MEQNINKETYFKPSKREILDLFLIAITSKGGILEDEKITVITPIDKKGRNNENR